MKLYTKVATLVAALGMGVGAYADDTTGLYIGGDVGRYGIDIDDVRFDDDAGFVRGVVGMRLSENLAIEGDYTKLYETSGDLLGSDADLDAHAWGISLRPILPLTERVELYGKVGWSWYDFELSTTANGVPLNEGDREDDFTWGAGVEYHLTDNLSLGCDFTRIEVDDADLNLVSAKLKFRF